MRKHLELFDEFITVQKSFFEQHLAPYFSQKWDDNSWVSGVKGTGWLRGNGKQILRFDEINRLKGIEGKKCITDKNYIDFTKAILILVYRGRKNTISPAVAMATLMILKRWYCSLIEETGQSHPIYLTTTVISRSMEIFSAASKPGDPNISNYKSRCANLQKYINHKSFTLAKLNYISDSKFTGKTNLTKKARETMALKHHKTLDDASKEDAEELITIKGFMNIVALINRVETDSEKIALNCLLLLVVTGFRSVEAFNLRHDALIKRQIDDPAIRERLKAKGLPNYFLGVKYVGVKGAGERVHWVEPLAAPLVENIFNAVQELTAPMRAHLRYLRSKGFSDFLPQVIFEKKRDYIELDEIVKFIAQTASEFRGQGGMRDKASKALKKRGLSPCFEEVKIGSNGKAVYFRKNDINRLVKKEFGVQENNAALPCSHAWVENGKKYEVNYEDLLFLHYKGSLSLHRTMAFLANPMPLENQLLNKFLGNLDPENSVFSKYKLLEDDGQPTRLRTHIPRHNINTFLAIAEVSDHLQAMLMGRVDIAQNVHYQHLALSERRKAASIFSMKQPLTDVSALVKSPAKEVKTPLDIFKQTGYMIVSDRSDLEMIIKANLHTFDGREDTAAFIEDSFDYGLFEDIAEAFEEIKSKEGEEAASSMVKRHAVLNPLKFGSCMREVNLWGCPYRMKCQSSEPCEHFTTTGRIDEYSNISRKKDLLVQSKSQLQKLIKSKPGYEKALENVDLCIQQLNRFEQNILNVTESKYLVSADSILRGELKADSKISTLSQLFALEHKKILKDIE